MKVAYLLTTYNRRDVSLKCIRQLITLSEKLNLIFDIFVTDDNSSDDTYQAIIDNFPCVKITKATGSMFWNRGMFLSWYYALQNHYDGYIWVNDDNDLFDFALDEILAAARLTNYNAIICGAFCSQNGEFTYGGLTESFSKIVPNGKLQHIHYMNGNFVYVPNSIVKKIGIIDPLYIQIKGDYDYGLTAIENGFDIFSTTRYVGISPRNPIGNSRGRKKGQSLSKRLFDSFHSPFLENPIFNLYFNIKHSNGLLKSIVLFLKAILVQCIPDFFYYKIRK